MTNERREIIIVQWYSFFLCPFGHAAFDGSKFLFSQASGIKGALIDFDTRMDVIRETLRADEPKRHLLKLEGQGKAEGISAM